MISDIDQTTIRGYLAREPAAWKQVEGWVVPVVRKPRWRFDCDHDDVIHHVLVAVYEQLEGFRGASSLKTYVCTIAFNISVSHDRLGRQKIKQLELEKIEVAAPNPGPLEELLKKELAELSAAAVETILEQAQRECLELWVMRYWGSLTEDVIARTLGIAPGTVKSRASRCREKARRALGLDCAGENL